MAGVITASVAGIARAVSRKPAVSGLPGPVTLGAILAAAGLAVGLGALVIVLSGPGVVRWPAARPSRPGHRRRSGPPPAEPAGPESAPAPGRLPDPAEFGSPAAGWPGPAGPEMAGPTMAGPGMAGPEAAGSPGAGPRIPGQRGPAEPDRDQIPAEEWLSPFRGDPAPAAAPTGLPRPGDQEPAASYADDGWHPDFLGGHPAAEQSGRPPAEAAAQYSGPRHDSGPRHAQPAGAQPAAAPVEPPEARAVPRESVRPHWRAASKGDGQQTGSRPKLIQGYVVPAADAGLDEAAAAERGAGQTA